MAQATNLIPVVPNRKACDVFSAWATRHGIPPRFSCNRHHLVERSPSEEKDSIYFASPLDCRGPIKVGWSRSPLRRMRKLHTREHRYVCRVVLADFGFVDEGSVHEYLAPFRDHGEFYKQDSPVAELMSDLLAAAVLSDFPGTPIRTSANRCSSCGMPLHLPPSSLLTHADLLAIASFNRSINQTYADIDAAVRRTELVVRRGMPRDVVIDETTLSAELA